MNEPDPLSEALRSVRLSGAIFLDAELSAPWGFDSPPASAGARLLAPSADELIHRKPAHAWTVATLAQRAGVSRTVFAERFTRLLGEPPLTYVSRCRMQLGARLLETTDD